MQHVKKTVISKIYIFLKRYKHGKSEKEDERKDDRKKIQFGIFFLSPLKKSSISHYMKLLFSFIKQFCPILSGLKKDVAKSHALPA